ncbi:Hypothetical predicted protein [Lecanosticta acicola]|uniref:Uncharacterized protein n=1 Tax=Lecanosticta acicola TaxID=111012 RepID=A0AAI9EFU3_9PEZI|nr:Hypothetical predicted protein [Lecanosticta acicola]
MGRRPNALVQEYFERGQKLPDASNRYSHTCKRCKEFFPKGRVDGLMSHILRRCPNVSQEDRQVVFRAMSQTHLEASHPTGYGIQSPGNAEQIEQIDSVQYEVPASFLQREQSALDTLAEVSRQHLNYSAYHNHFDAAQQQPIFDAEEDLVEQNLLAQLKAACKEDSNDIASPTNLDPVDGRARSILPDSPPVPEHEETGAVGPSPLVRTASAANEHLKRKERSPDRLEPQLEENTPVSELNQSSAASESHGVSWAPANGSFAAAFAGGLSIMLPFDEANPGFGMIQRPAKSKIRNRFTDSRRKEVQEIRKRGACLRCRMLKKPCSEGNPCNTCKSVESARVWKGACLRTRLADEFTLWSTGLFHARAAIDVAGAVHGMLLQPLSACIEAKLFSVSGVPLTLAARRYTANYSKETSTAPNFQHADGERSSSDIVVLVEGVGLKVESHLKQSVRDCAVQETCTFLRATIEQAQEMIKAEHQIADSPDATATRSSYSLQDQLLGNVIELWTETAVLARLQHNDIELKCIATNEPISPLVEVEDFANDHPSAVAIRSRKLISAQLLAAIETRCSAQSKVVLNELERRLLQRQQVSRFATYISSVLLLNCIERMTGIYRSLDPIEIADSNPNSDSDADQMRPNAWPLHEPPRKLWLQGGHFADLLIMLLRMRALPPKTSTQEGKLVVDQSQTVPVSINGRSAKEQTEEQTTIPAAWLDPIELHENNLLAIRDSGLPDPAKGATGWDMKFISRLLLPEKKESEH